MAASQRRRPRRLRESGPPSAAAAVSVGGRGRPELLLLGGRYGRGGGWRWRGAPSCHVAGLHSGLRLRGRLSKEWPLGGAAGLEIPGASEDWTLPEEREGPPGDPSGAVLAAQSGACIWHWAACTPQ